MAVPAGGGLTWGDYVVDASAGVNVGAGARNIHHVSSAYINPVESMEAHDPEVARTQLVEALTKARLMAGNPPLKNLALSPSHRYSVSMLSKVFSGKALPSSKLLRGLAETLNVEMSTFTGVWQPLWRAAHASKPAPAPAHTKADAATTESSSPPPGGFECPACGSWVVNPARHIEWHLELETGTKKSGGHLRIAE
jgi:hypothetical protein